MLLNVRLGPEEERAVRGLRRAKVNVSALVRAALRSAAGGSAGARRSPGAIVREVLDELPAPARPSRRPRLDDREAVAAFLREKLRHR